MNALENKKDIGRHWSTFCLSKNTCVHLCDVELYSRALKRDSHESAQYEDFVVYLCRIHGKIIVFLFNEKNVGVLYCLLGSPGLPVPLANTTKLPTLCGSGRCSTMATIWA